MLIDDDDDDNDNIREVIVHLRSACLNSSWSGQERSIF